MSLTNETVLNRVASTIGALEKMSQKDLLATPMPQFVEEYNRTRLAFVGLNPAFAESVPPEILDQCRYVELLAYSKQIQGLLRKIWLKKKDA